MRIKTVVCLVLMLLCANGLFAGQFDAYKQARGDTNWHTKLNNFIDAVSSFYTSISASLASVSNLVSNWALTEDYLVVINATPTYSDNNTFTVPGDLTAKFGTGKAIHAYCGADGMKYSTVASASYGGGVTTVNINDTVLTGNLAQVYVVATRSGLFPNDPGYVLAGDYGVPGQATLQAALAAVGVSGKVLIITPGTWEISSAADQDVAVNVQVLPGAVFDRTGAGTGKLNFQGAFSAAPVQCFADDSTGKNWVAFTGVKDGYPEWWGAVGDLSNNDTDAVQAALNALKTVKFIKNYLVDGVTYAAGNVLQGDSEFYSSLKMNSATGFVIGPADPTTAKMGVAIRNLSIDMDQKGYCGIMFETVWHSTIKDVVVSNIPSGTYSYDGNATQSKAGITVKGMAGQTGCYYNQIHNVYLYGQVGSYGNVGLLVTGSLPGSTSNRANANDFNLIKAKYCTIGVYEENGTGNSFNQLEVSHCTRGVITGSNSLRYNYCQIYAENVGEIPVLLNGRNGRVDTMNSVSYSGNEAQFTNITGRTGAFTADETITFTYEAGSVTYVDGDTFTISGDKTSYFATGATVKADCGVDGIKTSTVATATYSAPDTTVNLNSSVLTANLVTANLEATAKYIGVQTYNFDAERLMVYNVSGPVIAAATALGALSGESATCASSGYQLWVADLSTSGSNQSNEVVRIPGYDIFQRYQFWENCLGMLSPYTSLHNMDLTFQGSTTSKYLSLNTLNAAGEKTARLRVKGGLYDQTTVDIPDDAANFLLNRNYMEIKILGSAPSAPAAGKVRIYAINDGGKVKLAALFPTGAEQQLAIQP